MIELREYQQKSVDKLREFIASGVRLLMLVAPTGAGKTVMFAFLVLSALSKSKRALIIAHRRELINQPYEKLKEFGVPENQLSVTMAKDHRYKPAAPIQVASIDTLRHRTLPEADIVIIDEAHRSLAKSYLQIIEHYRERGAVIIGTTATPIRIDNKSLGDVYDELVVSATYMQLVELGFLVEPQVFTVPIDQLPDLEGVSTRAGEYAADELEIAVDKRQLVGSIVDHWRARGNDSPTFCFCCSVAHSKNVASAFVSAGISAIHVDGETEKPVRDEALKKLARGDVKVICNVDVFCEGTDCPAVKTIILARPTKSLRVYLQQVGRGSRPYLDRPFVVLDHARTVLNHGLPQYDREWSLVPPKKKKRKTSDEVVPSCKTCPECFAIVPSKQEVCRAIRSDGTACPHVFEVIERQEVENIDGTLAEVKMTTLEERRAKWDELVKTANDRGYRDGWAYYRFIDEFGHKPPKEWRVVKEKKKSASIDEKIEFLDRMQLEAHRLHKKPGYAFARYRQEFGEDPPSQFQLTKARDALPPKPAEEKIEWDL